ncbi:zinc-binding dehydrogenase [Breznakiella homolactica]|uniref:Zinc-binding dehydrogenase n=1 Tax=Breznakiella homolactica TaxID=2798577 RepID=A0A7T7XK17_9SPIR|nr:zinc-binding dehydrogenase [Breznakiella homolactica]QQO07673.1 zinc-binding dehydrogenase [Breznakiella homolactica]
MKMNAVVLKQPGPPETLAISRVPVPAVKPGWVLVKVKAFGINRSEIYTRQGHSPSVKLPRIIGIELAGQVADPSDSGLEKGAPVVSLMKGLGREFDGSYAEYCLIPADQVYPVDTSLDWPRLAAVPETWYTAYGSLTESLGVQAGETLLIRGGTSAAGLAALALARALGLRVFSTTRSEGKTGPLKAAGADEALVDDGNLTAVVKRLAPGGADKVLELTGAATLRDSLKLTRPGGIVCFTGILSGWVLDNFEPIDDIPSGVYLTSFHSDSVSRKAMAELFTLIEEKAIPIPEPVVFGLGDIRRAHELMESGAAGGKIVVVNE